MEIVLNTMDRLAKMEPAGQYFVLEDFGTEGLVPLSRHAHPHSAITAAMESCSVGVCVMKLVAVKIEEL